MTVHYIISWECTVHTVSRLRLATVSRGLKLQTKLHARQTSLQLHITDNNGHTTVAE